MAKAISKPLALAVAVGLTLGGSFGAGAPAFAQQDSASQSNEGSPPGVISDDLMTVLSKFFQEQLRSQRAIIFR